MTVQIAVDPSGMLVAVSTAPESTALVHPVRALGMIRELAIVGATAADARDAVDRKLRAGVRRQFDVILAVVDAITREAEAWPVEDL